MFDVFLCNLVIFLKSTWARRWINSTANKYVNELKLNTSKLSFSWIEFTHFFVSCRLFVDVLAKKLLYLFHIEEKKKVKNVAQKK